MTLEELKKQIADDDQIQSKFLKACEDDDLSSFLDGQNFQATTSDIENLVSYFKNLKEEGKKEDVDVIKMGKEGLNWIEKIIDFFKKLTKTK